MTFQEMEEISRGQPGSDVIFTTREVMESYMGLLIAQRRYIDEPPLGVAYRGRLVLAWDLHPALMVEEGL